MISTPTSGTIVLGECLSLSPPHASTHITGGSDVMPNFTSVKSGLTPASGGGTVNFLRADGSWIAPPASTINNELIESSFNSSTLSFNHVLIRNKYLDNNLSTDMCSMFAFTNVDTGAGTVTVSDLPSGIDLVNTSSGKPWVMMVIESNNGTYDPGQGGDYTTYLRIDAVNTSTKVINYTKFGTGPNPSVGNHFVYFNPWEDGFERNSNNPILQASDFPSLTGDTPSANEGFNDGKFDQHDVQLGTIMYDTGSATYKMWYTGNNNYTSDNLVFGYATSSDGEIWGKNSSSILGYGPAGADDDDGIYCPFVLYDSDATIYKMWYIGKKNTASTEKFKLMYATSSDGISWTKNGTTAIYNDAVLGAGMFAPFVLKISSTNWLLLYSGVDQPNDGLRYATSTDGITWTYQGIFLSPGSTGEWDEDTLMWPTIFLDNSTLYCYYRGDRKQTDGYGGNAGHVYIGLATTSCTNKADIPSKLTSLSKYASNPVLSPSIGATTLWDGGIVNSPAICLNTDQDLHKDSGDSIFMYYTGCNNVAYGTTHPTLPTYNDDRIGLAKSSDFFNFTRVTGLSSNGDGCVVTWGNGDRGDGSGHFSTYGNAYVNVEGYMWKQDGTFVLFPLVKDTATPKYYQSYATTTDFFNWTPYNGEIFTLGRPTWATDYLILQGTAEYLEDENLYFSYAKGRNGGTSQYIGWIKFSEDFSTYEFSPDPIISDEEIDYFLPDYVDINNNRNGYVSVVENGGEYVMMSLLYTKFVGTHTGGNGVTTLVDSTAKFEPGTLAMLQGTPIKNVTKSTSGTISDNTETTVTTSITWDNGDSYEIDDVITRRIIIAISNSRYGPFRIQKIIPMRSYVNDGSCGSRWLEPNQLFVYKGEVYAIFGASPKYKNSGTYGNRAAALFKMTRDYDLVSFPFNPFFTGLTYMDHLGYTEITWEADHLGFTHLIVDEPNNKLRVIYDATYGTDNYKIGVASKDLSSIE